jgi:nucleoside-diphosphate-sugar epimerase
MFCNILDITDTTKLIGWIPKLSIEQGIAKLMAESTI